jgi:PTS system nitrogen regulatory IIA component
MKLSIEQVAQSLDLPRSTIERWIRQGHIPIQKSGGGLVFNRTTLQRWAAQHRLVFRPPDETAQTRPEQAPESLRAAMQRGGVHAGLVAEDRDQAIAAVVNVVPGIPEEMKPLLRNRLLEREQMASTGIGKGVAFPHPRTPIPGFPSLSTIVTGFFDTPVDFSAMDERPVTVLFVLLCPTVQAHLYLLSRLSYCLRHDAFSRFLKPAPAEAELLAKIGEFEAQLDGGSP